MTASVLNTKINEVQNKIPVVSDLVKKTHYNAKMSEIEGRYITTSDYNKFTKEALDAMTKQKELVNKSNISNPVKNFNLNTKLAILAELKAEQDKFVKLEASDLSYCHGKNFVGDDGCQNMFVYQPTLTTLELKKEIVNAYIVYDLDAWRRNPTNNFKFKNFLLGATSIVKLVLTKSGCIVAME